MLILSQSGSKIFDTTNSAIWISNDNRICLCAAEEHTKPLNIYYELGAYGNYVTAQEIMRNIAEYASAGRGAFAMPSTDRPKKIIKRSWYNEFI